MPSTKYFVLKINDMKNIMLGVIFSVFSTVGFMKAFAQETKENKEPKESQEIIIRKNGEKDTKVTVEINGDNVTINGKPLAEFKEDGVKIMNRKMIIRDGDKITMMLGNDNLKGLGLGDLSNIDIEKSFGNDDNNFTQRFSNKSKVYLGVMTNDDNKDGAIIKKVMKGSPAANAGLQIDDIIYKVDNEKTTNPMELGAYVGTKKAGDKVKVYFLRDGKKQDVTATLAVNKEQKENMRVFKYNMPNGNARSFSMPRMEDLNMEGSMDGMQFEGFGYNSRPRLGIKIQDTEDANGVKILDVEKTSSGATAGLLKDDIIVGIGDKKINNTDEAREALNENKDKATYSMKVKRNGTEININVKIPKKLKTANL